MDAQPPASGSALSRVVLFFLRPRVALQLMPIVLLCLAPFLYRGYRISEVPHVDEPFEVETVAGLQVPGERNAFVEYQQAAKLSVCFHDYAPDCSAPPHYVWGYPNEDVTDAHRKWLAGNEKALAVWRRGTEKPDALWPQPDGVTYGPLSFEGYQLRPLVFLKVDQMASEGRLDDAWQWLRAALRYSRHQGRHCGIVQRCQAYHSHGDVSGAMAWWASHPRVTAAQLKAALHDVRVEFRRTPPPSHNLKYEYVAWKRFLEQRDVDEILAADIFMREGAEWEARLARGALYSIGEPKRTRILFRHAFANWLQLVDQPLHAKRYSACGLIYASGDGDLASRELSQRINQMGLTRWLLPSIKVLDRVVAREQATQSMLQMTLACQWYYREHRRFPATAAELVPDYLDGLPRDPLAAAGQLLQYRKTSTGAVVWSVGYDRIDDGGVVVRILGVHSVKNDHGLIIFTPGSPPPRRKPEEIDDTSPE